MLAVATVASVGLAARYVYDEAPGTDAALRSFPLDDSFIHLVYGRALIEEGTFAYNPGQAETGATSPLWALLVAGIFALKKLGLELPTVESVKLLSVSCSVASAWFAGLFARRVSGRLLAGLLATCLVALEPSLSFARVSGMEVALASALLLAGVWALASERRTLAAFLLGLSPLARPELALCLVLLLPFVLIFRREPRAALPNVLRGVLGLAPAALWCAYCVEVSGRPLPSTFYAKHRSTGLFAHFEDLGSTLTNLLVDLPVLSFGLGLVPLALGVRSIVRSEVFGPPAARWATGLLPFALLLGVVWAHNLAQAGPFYWYRYVLPAVPLLCTWIALGTVAAWQALKARRLLALPALGCLALCWLVTTVQQIPAKARLFAWNCQNIAEAQVVIGRWLAQHVPPMRSVATVDAGAVRYYSHRPTIDLRGLNTHQVLSEGVNAVLARERPYAYVTFPAVTPELMHAPSLGVMFETYAKHYTICDCDQVHMVVLGPRTGAP
jgi:hypothetical protein